MPAVSGCSQRLAADRCKLADIKNEAPSRLRRQQLPISIGLVLPRSDGSAGGYSRRGLPPQCSKPRTQPASQSLPSLRGLPPVSARIQAYAGRPTQTSRMETEAFFDCLGNDNLFQFGFRCIAMTASATASLYEIDTCFHRRFRQSEWLATNA
jgi:hypothetical protein